jgi:hypothetical protein
MGKMLKCLQICRPGPCGSQAKYATIRQHQIKRSFTVTPDVAAMAAATAADMAADAAGAAADAEKTTAVVEAAAVVVATAAAAAVAPRVRCW